MTHARVRTHSPVAFTVLAGLLLLAFLPACSRQTGPTTPPAAATLWLEGNNGRLKTSVYQSANLSAHPVLIVVLHGDLLGFRQVPRSTYHYVFADQVTRQMEDVVVAAVLRPGYRDHTGERSDGDQGLATGDNYTPEVVDSVAEAIEQLKMRYSPSYTVLMGHSGGAAITGNLLGRAPSAVDGALLLACPCNLGEWREFMKQNRGNSPIWSAPIHSLSPQELAGSVSPDVHVAVLVGADDDVAPPSMSTAYAETLKKHVDNVTLTIAPGLGHEILLDPVTYESLNALVQGLRRNEQQ